jgi:hypothetical protein
MGSPGAEEMESPEAPRPEEEEMESPEASRRRPEEVETPEASSRRPEEVGSPEAILREEVGSPGASRRRPEVVGSTWWRGRACECLTRVKLSARLGAATNIRTEDWRGEVQQQLRWTTCMSWTQLA